MEEIISKLPPDIRQWVVDLGVSGITDIIISAYEQRILPVLDNKTQKKQCAPVIGLEGEMSVYNMLQSKYPIINTSKRGKRGDFAIDRIMIEVKKYKRTIPSTEVSKFYRDLDANADMRGGIMISLNSNFVSHTNAITRGNHGNTPVMFVCLKNLTDSIAQSCLYMVIDLMMTEIDSKHLVINSDIANAINNIDISIGHLSQSRQTLHETQNIINKQIGKLMQQILASEIHIQNTITTLRSNISDLTV